jgi:hypothetical protein
MIVNDEYEKDMEGNGLVLFYVGVWGGWKNMKDLSQDTLSLSWDLKHAALLYKTGVLVVIQWNSVITLYQLKLEHILHELHWKSHASICCQWLPCIVSNVNG